MTQRILAALCALAIMVGCTDGGTEPLNPMSNYHGTLSKWYSCYDSTAEAYGYFHNNGLDFIANNHSVAYDSSSYDSLMMEQRELTMLFMVDSMKISADSIGMIMASYDWVATGFDSLNISVRDYVQNNFDECGHSSDEEQMILDILDVLDDTTRGIAEVRADLQSIEGSWQTATWGQDEGRVAGLVLYVALYSLDYAEQVLSSMPKMPKRNAGNL